MLKVSLPYSSDSNLKTALFNYSGVIDQDLLKDIVNFHEDVFSKENTCHTFKRKVITSMIETLQNITRYGLKNSEGRPEGNFVSFYSDSNFTFECSNKINGDQVNRMERQLSELSSSPLESLKDQYSERLNEEWVNPETGAKLGLLYLFINSDKNISYTFHSKEENNYLFILKVSLKR